MMFTGQLRDGKPNGFVRARTAYGDIYEGFMDHNCSREGFGRQISTNGEQKIGWFKNNKAHGNQQYIFDDGSVLEEGYYQNGYICGPYTVDHNEYLEDSREYMKLQILPNINNKIDFYFQEYDE